MRFTRLAHTVVLFSALGSLGSLCGDDEGTTPRCGNGQCETREHGETLETCRADCELLCGNDECDESEEFETCPDDCFCGDGACSANEDLETCRTDCGLAGCGDRECDWVCSDETPLSCPQDCDATCGNDTCEFESGENYANCQDDCPMPECGDGHCAWLEWSVADCPEDCSEGSLCGNGFCEDSSCLNDTLESCPEDCARKFCGDGVCAPGIEDEGTFYCEADCGCGNGACQVADGETFENCAEDCHCGDGSCADRDGETTGNCPDDCHCGNGDCEFSLEHACEMANREVCTADCEGADICGNGVCDSDESDESCPPDCGADAVLCEEPSIDEEPVIDAGPDPVEPPVVSEVTPSGTVGVAGAEVSFSATASESPTAWSWDFGGGTTADTSTDASPEVTLGAAGTYTGSVTASNAGGDSAAFSFMYTVSALPSAPSVTSIYGPSTPHSGENGQFSALIDGTATSYAWDFGGGATPNTSTDATPTVTFGSPGDYDVTLTVSNAGGSSAPSSTPYTVAPAVAGNPPVINALSQTGYLGATDATINFNASATDIAGATWVWDFGTGATLYGPSEQFTQITLGTPGLHQGRVTATTAAGSGMLDFTFLVTATTISAPSFQSFSVASSPLVTIPPTATLLGDGRPLVGFVASTHHIAASVSDAAAPIGAASFTVHEVDAAPTAAPRALATALLGTQPVLAYLYPSTGGDLVVAVAIGSAAPTQTSDWAKHEVLSLPGGAASVAADLELTVIDGRLVLAIVSDAGLRMAYAQVALPALGSDWASHVLDASATLTDCALGSLDGAVVTYLDGAGTLRFASAATDPPTQTSDWATHSVETSAGSSDVSMTVMGTSIVLSTTDTTFGMNQVHRSLDSGPTAADDWEHSALGFGSAAGRHSMITLDGRLAIASMTSTTAAVPYVKRTVLPDLILIEAWQFEQLSGVQTNPRMGDALGLQSGHLAFCHIDAAASGSVVFTQANGEW